MDYDLNNLAALSVEQWEDIEASHDPRTCADPTCREVPADSVWVLMGMSVAPDGAVTFHHHAESTASYAAQRAREWGELCDTYRTAPQDFVTAFAWLNRHPIFAAPIFEGTEPDAQMSREDLRALEADADFDETVGMRAARASVWRDEAGAPRILLEHGPYLWPSQSLGDLTFSTTGTSTIDPDLSVTASTYEEAVVALAARVHEKYGTSRGPAPR